MPPRLARSSIAVAAPKNAKNKSKKRNLNAYSIASHSIKPSKVAKHRLGESIDDNPRQKRRKINSDDEEDEDEDASEDDPAPRRKLPKGKGRGIAEEDEDGIEEGSDSEGNEWVLGGLADDDEDSDLDSEEAFGESDEEKFEGFTFRGSSSAKAAPKRKDSREIDLDEVEEGEEDEEEDDFGDEGVDLATMLDDENADMESAEEDESEEDDSEDEEMSEPESEEDDGANDEERLARFRDRIEALDASNQPTQSLPDAEDTGALSLEDLLADMEPSEKKQFTSTLKPRKKSKIPQKLTAPLPKRQQDRLDREIANQKAKEQLDRWRDTVIQNRRAEFLTFPLVDPARTEPVGKDKFVTDGKPQGELEENIRKIMEESGMTAQPRPGTEVVGDGEEEIMQAEELGAKDMPIEEVMQRRAELRRNRELLFREEIKARRIAKIKSKAYRRVHRRERERQADKERSLLDPEGLGENMDEDEKEHNDRKRAEERMSTKHRDSKFGKAMKATNRTVWDNDAREGVQEQAKRKEELRRRMVGDDVGDGSGEEFDSDDDEVEGEDDGAALMRLKDQHGDGEEKVKGVGGMKFMRDAEERQRKRNEEDIERMRKDMAIADGDEADSADEAEVDGGLGRAIFGPKGEEDGKGKVAMQKQKRPEMEEGEMSGEEDAAEAENGVAAPTEKAPLKSAMKKSAGASGPLSKAALGRDRRDPNPEPAQSERQGAGLSSAWLNGENAKKGKHERRKNNPSQVAETIDLSTDFCSGKKGDETKALAKSAAVKPFAKNVETATSNPEEEEEEPSANPILTPSEQKADYHRRAFAGDNVQAAFQAEKEADAADQDEQEVSTHLPGWGSWTGSGLSKKIRKSNARAAHNPLFKQKLPGGVKAEDRKDRKLENVIVSEKRERKGKKYLAPILPRDFENGAQYERSLRVPVGPEWTTKEVFQRGTRPRVVIKPGAVVEAMERPLV